MEWTGGEHNGETRRTSSETTMDTCNTRQRKQVSASARRTSDGSGARRSGHLLLPSSVCLFSHSLSVLVLRPRRLPFERAAGASHRGIIIIHRQACDNLRNWRPAAIFLLFAKQNWRAQKKFQAGRQAGRLTGRLTGWLAGWLAGWHCLRCS